MQYNLKEIAMYDYTEVFDKYKELVDRINQVNEFWLNSLFSTIKAFFSL